jgi:putative copper resistance protein D
VDEALVFARLIHFTAAMTGFGSAAFRFYAIDDEAARGIAAALVSFDRWLGRVIQVSALVLLVSGFAMVSFITAGMAGTATAALDVSTITAVLFGTGFGRVWCWHLLFAALLTVSGTITVYRHALSLTWAALALGSLGWVGHAAGTGGWIGLGRELNQSVHLLAAGLWLGGLLPLGWLLGQSRRAENGLGVLAREAVPPFSQMGYAAVVAIAITGAVNTLFLIDGVDNLIGTSYGRLLSLKILFYLAMVAIALRNRFRLAPLRSGGRASGTGALYRSVLIEQAIGLAILAAVSVLGTWPPSLAPHY